ncbi:YebW family protein [Edaphovirga cremea]|uniref:YebW family protein n=1 Tax=Edaphovirga cremea TaxID=2267246 RepID=UPI000DEEDFC0|nr:YebW family protein [Edaphovirga cremea]
MYALVLSICYLGGSCDELIIDAFHTELQCLAAMDEQRLRHAACYPIEDFIDSYWTPAHENADF